MAAYFVDALRNTYEEDADWRPYPNAEDGTPARLTYAFLTSVPDWTPDEFGDPHDGFARYTARQIDRVERAIHAYEAVANVHFTRVEGTADVNFGQFDIGEADVQGYSWNTWTYKPTGDLYGYPDDDGLMRPNEVWYDTKIGVIHYDVVLHEVGHTLGLKHPVQYSDADPAEPVLPPWEDKGENTIMSYNREAGTDELGLYDIIALQSIYGPAQSRRGDNVYVFGEDKLIWDGGGEDRITARDAEEGVRLDLGGGTWNYEGAKGRSLLWGGQVFLGYYTEIENADGSAFDDRLTGNGLANRLLGLDGDDFLRGLRGPDRLVGGDGDDTLSGGDNRDRLLGGDGDDWLTGGRNLDQLRGGEGADRFIYTAAADSTVRFRDVVLDFHRSERDLVDLSGLAKDGPALRFVGTAGFSDRAGEVRYDHHAAEGTRIVADLDGDGTADFAIGLEGHIALREADLIL
ncbi:M10 family metallopeptidase C-terminal domain-containing protein [Amaricoccus solimangrovi]|uniref:Peptidase metallopeptidase domain-containing protein n=1 Tax=Amaricoccus solimangrovi TaxID=2589815 RepID=A0A501WYA2_9RHOB|nr:M10 family metallopeptidase C-terminal domain-containing protein [Amaricoccus solimangrovi]TPE53732.1 hypothetical protein FJM51_01415 [Amaricoccus solimangrovi]